MVVLFGFLLGCFACFCVLVGCFVLELALLRSDLCSTFEPPKRDIVNAFANSFNQHNKVRRPGESHRGAGRKKNRNVAKTCDNNTQTIPNNMVLLAKTGDMQAGLETFNQQPCSPESCHSVTLAKSIAFLVKLRHFFAKRSLQQSHFRGRNTLAFWTRRSGPPQYIVCQLGEHLFFLLQRHNGFRLVVYKIFLVVQY